MAYQIIGVGNNNYQFETKFGLIYNIYFEDISAFFQNGFGEIESNIYFLNIEVYINNAKSFERHPRHITDIEIGETILNFVLDTFSHRDGVIISYYNEDGAGIKRKELFLSWASKLQEINSDIEIITHCEQDLLTLFLFNNNPDFDKIISIFNELDI